MKKEQIFSKSYAGQLLKRRKIEEVGTLVDHIINEGITCPKRILEDFGIDYKTTKALRCCRSTVSNDTLGKFCYAIAFYLEEWNKHIEADTNIIKRREGLDSFNLLLDRYKSIYGIEATCVLELARKNYDLRSIVKT